MLGRLLSGAFWLGLQVPLQLALSLWSLRLILDAIGPEGAGAYRFAGGLGFFQLLLEVGIGSALQRQVSAAWDRGDRTAVDQAVASAAMIFAILTLVQLASLLAIAAVALPHSGFGEEAARLVLLLLILQAVVAPLFFVALLAATILQAAHRYDFVPRCELAITALRFLVLVAGVEAGCDFFLVVLAQTVVTLTLRIGPALRVIVRELGYTFRFRGVDWEGHRAMIRFGLSAILLQLSLILADKIDTTILGLMLADPGPQIAIYDVVSKPFAMLRQSSWMFASMVMPAVASLAATRNVESLEAIKYDGARLHLGALLPVGLQAWIYAGPFLSLWFGRRLGYDAKEVAPLMRLFLVAAVPIVLAVPIQTAIGLGKVGVVALSASAGLMASVPLGCYLAPRFGVAGIIWGAAATAFVANLLVPSVSLFRSLLIDPKIYARRVGRGPLIGAAALVIASAAVGRLIPIADYGSAPGAAAGLLALHLAASGLAYLGGYALDPFGHRDLANLIAQVRRRWPVKRRPPPPSAADK